MASARAEARYRLALNDRCKLEGRVKTILTTGYNVNWTNNDAVREIIQNLFDGIIVTYGHPNVPLAMECIKCVSGE